MLLGVAGLEASRGDRLRDFYRAHFDRVYSFVYYRVGGSAADAEDVTQETFVAALRDLDRFEGRSTLQTWLLGIAKNKAHEKLRDRGRSMPAPSDALRQAIDSLEASDVPSDVTHAEETARLVGAALAELPEHYRAALSHKYVRGLTLQQMAEAEQCSAKAVESKVQRARRAFADALRRLLRDSGPTAATPRVER
jgi:RNA polymerase sigma-70 factor, ECF subfamily